MRRLLGLLALAGVMAGCRESMEGRFIYYPSRALAADPASVGLGFRDVTFAAADGVQLHGWLIAGRVPTTLLYSHGNGGNIGDRVRIARLLVDQLGVGVFMYDYRGSLGAAVTVDLAVAHPPRGVVLESPFASVRAMGNAVLPGAGLLFRTRWDSLAKIAGLRAPLLVIHGETDEVVPFAQGRAVFEAAPQPKTFVTLRGSRHYELEAAWSDYWAAWRRFIADLQLQ
jgi:fermentation-respiration switch protein FrsA (DUF1100 family)